MRVNAYRLQSKDYWWRVTIGIEYITADHVAVLEIDLLLWKIHISWAVQ